MVGKRKGIEGELLCWHQWCAAGGTTRKGRGINGATWNSGAQNRRLCHRCQIQNVHGTISVHVHPTAFLHRDSRTLAWGGRVVRKVCAIDNELEVRLIHHEIQVDVGQDKAVNEQTHHANVWHNRYVDGIASWIGNGCGGQNQVARVWSARAWIAEFRGGQVCEQDAAHSWNGKDAHVASKEHCPSRVVETRRSGIVVVNGNVYTPPKSEVDPLGLVKGLSSSSSRSSSCPRWTQCSGGTTCT